MEAGCLFPVFACVFICHIAHKPKHEPSNAAGALSIALTWVLMLMRSAKCGRHSSHSLLGVPWDSSTPSTPCISCAQTGWHWCGCGIHHTVSADCGPTHTTECVGSHALPSGASAWFHHAVHVAQVGRGMLLVLCTQKCKTFADGPLGCALSCLKLILLSLVHAAFANIMAIQLPNIKFTPTQHARTAPWTSSTWFCFRQS